MTRDMETSGAPDCVEADGSEKSPEKPITSLDVEHSPSPNGVHEDDPPNGGYGWVCVACSFWINAHTWGINSAYAVFLADYLTHNRFPGASSLQFAFVGGLSISQAFLVSPLVTYTTRVYGTRTTLLIGVFLEALALVSASFTQQIWQLFLSQGVCFGLGMGFLFLGSVGVIPQWFTTRRSFANGIATAGSGVGGVIYSLASNAMIEKIGIGWALRILGILAFVVNFVCAMLLKDRNKAIGVKQSAFDYVLLRRYEFLLLLGWGIFSMLGYVVLLFSLPDYALSIGLSSHQGSIVAALLQLGGAIGRPLVGFISDSVGRINTAGFLTFFCCPLCLLLWVFAKSFGVLIIFAILVGTVTGVFFTTIAPVGTEVVGLKQLPAALSLTWLVIALPATFAESIALELRQENGNIYLHAQLFAGFMYVAASICLLALRVWKMGQNERDAAEKAKAVKEADVAEPPTATLPASSRSELAKTSVVKRLFQWKRV